MTGSGLYSVKRWAEASGGNVIVAIVESVKLVKVSLKVTLHMYITTGRTTNNTRNVGMKC